MWQARSWNHREYGEKKKKVPSFHQERPLGEGNVEESTEKKWMTGRKGVVGNERI